jgi:ankyrin repeat protein
VTHLPVFRCGVEEQVTAMTGHIFRHGRRLGFLLLLLWVGSTSSLASDLLDAVKAEDLDSVTAALSAGADVNELDPSTLTALHMAASRGAVDIAGLLINAGADVNAQAGSGQGLVRPLHLATQFNRPAVVALLLQHGADVDATTSRGETALLLAAKSGYVDIAEQLLQSGADPLAAEASYGDTAIYIAAMNGFLDVVKLMVSSGVDVNLQNSRTGETALWVAAMDNRADVVAFLLSAGADPNIANGKGQTPLQMSSDPAVQDVLRKAGAKD